MKYIKLFENFDFPTEKYDRDYTDDEQNSLKIQDEYFTCKAKNNFENIKKGDNIEVSNYYYPIHNQIPINYSYTYNNKKHWISLENLLDNFDINV